MTRIISYRIATVLGVLLLCFTSVAYGQTQTGNVFGMVSDTQGGALPGVGVTLTGGGAPQTQLTDEVGQFRFLGLSPGTYRIEAALDGYSTVIYETVNVAVGRNTTLELGMQAAIEDVITVTSESPLLDSRKITAGATISKMELEKIPSARDPWVVLQTTPGVRVDRVNVGGNESGQQSGYVGPGSADTDSTWSVDGVVITDMSAVGSSPAYYNFDSFAEIEISTGGSDVTRATGGVTLNMVTKRGTNEWRGTARYITAQNSWQSSLSFNQSDLGEGQDEFEQGNRIDGIDEYGADIGGPIVKDKLWIWANYSLQHIVLLTIDDVEDDTELENYGAKVNAQLAQYNSAVFYYALNEKTKIGRNASPTRPQETTWNQTGPGEIYKIEDTHIFSPSFFLTGLYAFSESPFELTPQGGLDGPSTANDWSTGVWHDNFLHHDTDRPAKQGRLDGSYFFGTAALDHELKFGVGYRKADLESTSIWPGNGVRWQGYTYYGYDYNVFGVAQTLHTEAETEYTSVYMQDTMTVGNLTANLGLRYDKQEGQWFDTSIPGVDGFEAFPDGTPLLPAVSAQSPGVEFSWDDIVPRLGLTYALGETKDTLLRFSYARFAEQLSQGYITTSLGIGYPNYRYAYFYYFDANGDLFVTPDEIVDWDGWTNGYNVDGTSLSQIDPNFSAPLSDEIILGVEHALLPEFVIGASITMRNNSNLVEQERLVEENGVVRQHVHSDYVLDEHREAELPDGSINQVPIWILREGVSDTGGEYFTNGDREQNYLGYSLTFNKRLSNRWMARGNFTWDDFEWDVPQSEAEDPNIYLGGDYDDGGPVLNGSGTGSGSKGGVYISPGWSYSLTGLYQIAPDRPWGFNFSAALNGRSGYAIPYYLGRLWVGDYLSSINVQATPKADTFSLDDVHTFDMRLEKEFAFNDLGFIVGAEVFNLFNQSTVLQREHRVNRSTYDHVREILSPRIFRVSARINLR